MPLQAILLFFLTSQKSSFLETEVAALASDSLANNDMVEELHSQKPGAGDDSFGEAEICLRRSGLGGRGVRLPLW